MMRAMEVQLKLGDALDDARALNRDSSRSTGTLNISKITTRAGNHVLKEQLSCDDEKPLDMIP
jgi:hypothetical protein